MKSTKIPKLLILLALFTYTSSVGFAPITPTDTASVNLDAATGSSSPMSIHLDNGSFLTVYQVTSTTSTIYYSKDTTNSATQIVANTNQAQPWVVGLGGSDAAVLYEVFANQSTDITLSTFTLSTPAVLKVGSQAGSSFTETYPNMSKSGSSIGVVWSNATYIYGMVYTISGTTLTPGNQATLPVTCTANCFGRLVKSGTGKFAIVSKLVASPYTMNVQFLNADLTKDTTVNSGNALAISNAPTVANFPAACGRTDGTEIAVISISNTNFNVYIINTTTGAVIGQGPCVFNVSPSRASIKETSTAGLYAVSYTSSNKAFVLYVDNSCSQSILANGTNMMQVDATAGVNQDYTSLAAVPASTTNAFFISYVETNTSITPNTVRIKARIYKMTSDCTDVSLFTIPTVTDPLTLANVTASNVYIVSLPTGILTDGSNKLALNTSVKRTTLGYTAPAATKTDQFTFKISSYDIACKASITVCAPGCASCNGQATDLNMYCVTCATNNYMAEGTKNCFTSSTPVPGFFFSTDKFKACYQTCKTCTEAGTSDLNPKCTACKDGYFPKIDIPSSCYSSTGAPPDGYFYDPKNKNFNKCYQSCKTCNGVGTDSNNNCITCGDRYLVKPGLSSSNCYDFTIDQLGYLYDQDDKKFIKCYHSCQTCAGEGNDTYHNCATCPTDSYGSVDAPNNCYMKTQPLIGYFYNKDEYMFQRCYPTCSTCIEVGDDFDHKCMTCLDSKGYFPIDSYPTMCYPGATIMEGFYFNTTVSVFKRCYGTCKTCNMGGSVLTPNCLTCLDGYDCRPCTGVIYDDACQDSCPENTYLDIASRTCMPCTADKPNCCTTYFFQKKCYTKCPDGTLPDQTGKSCYACFETGKFYYKNSCVDSCPRGSVVKDSVCNVCTASGQIFYNGKCIDACPSGLIPVNGACEYGLTLDSKICVNISFHMHH
jgi:hypothetical protein